LNDKLLCNWVNHNRDLITGVRHRLKVVERWLPWLRVRHVPDVDVVSFGFVNQSSVGSSSKLHNKLESGCRRGSLHSCGRCLLLVFCCSTTNKIFEVTIRLLRETVTYTLAHISFHWSVLGNPTQSMDCLLPCLSLDSVVVRFRDPAVSRSLCIVDGGPNRLFTLQP